MFKKILLSLIWFALSFGGFSCSSIHFKKTVPEVDVSRYMGTWYVWAGRTTSFEKGAYNAIERYTWNEKEKRIDIDFSYHKDSFEGELKKVPQKAWIVDDGSHAHWEISPFWPLLFDYLIIALDPGYQWVAIGVPSGDYLWLMGRQKVATDAQVNELVEKVKALGYPVQDVVRVPQQPL